MYATRNFGVTTVPAVRILDPKANLYYDLDAAGLPLVPRTTTIIAAVSDVRADRLTVRSRARARGAQKSKQGQGHEQGRGRGCELGREQASGRGREQESELGRGLGHEQGRE